MPIISSLTFGTPEFMAFGITSTIFVSRSKEVVPITFDLRL
jgi:hypothetical protein